MRSRFFGMAPLAACLLLAGCSDGGGATSTNPHDALFSPPSQATRTPDSIFGVWGGSAAGGVLDVRMHITPDRMVVANRCHFGETTVTAGVTSSIAVTDEDITVFESDDDIVPFGDLECRASLRPGQMSYQLDGTRLTFSEGKEELSLVKIRD